jgi:hypothetical protein
MATTTNYGWTTPNDTDLVKDGAAAIRTLGSSIDTTTKNLNPQTTTGALAYRSATANVNTALPIGTAGQILKVNAGATAPEWGSAGASFVGCALKATNDQSTTLNTDVAITFDSEDFDTDAFHDNSTNTSRITIPSGLGGKYLFTFTITDTNQSPNSNVSRPSLFKNGSLIVKTEGLFSNITYRYMAGSHLLDLAAADYIELKYFGESTGTIKSYRTFNCIKVG